MNKLDLLTDAARRRSAVRETDVARTTAGQIQDRPAPDVPERRKFNLRLPPVRERS